MATTPEFIESTTHTHEGHTYRVGTLADPSVRYMDWDADCYGPIAWVKASPMAWPQRPADFDGRARKLTTDDRSQTSFWWQPDPALADESLSEVAEAVRQAVTHGYAILVVERLSSETDAYGNPIVEAFSTLGGLDWETADKCVSADELDNAPYPLDELLFEVQPGNKSNK